MADTKKKRRSGRQPSSDEAPKSSKKVEKTGAPAPAHSDSNKLHSPWGPLMWMLVPLIVCVIYGVLSRGK